MEIRQLRPAELHSLLDLYRHLHAKDAPLPPREHIEAVWHEITRSARFRYFGAFERDVLVACCNLSVIPNLTRGCRPYGLIENVVTHAQWRRRGIGGALVQHVLNYAWSEDCYKVMLLTSRLDEDTLRFYESTGMNRYAKQGFVAHPPQQE